MELRPKNVLQHGAQQTVESYLTPVFRLHVTLRDPRDRISSSGRWHPTALLWNWKRQKPMQTKHRLSEWGFQVQRTPLYYIGIYWIVLTLCNHQWRFSEIKMTNPIFKICLCTVPLGEDSWGIRYGCGSKALYLVNIKIAGMSVHPPKI